MPSLEEKYKQLKARYIRDERVGVDFAAFFIALATFGIVIGTSGLAGFGQFLYQLSQLEAEISVSNQLLDLIRISIFVTAFLAALFAFGAMIVVTYLSEQMKKNLEKKLSNL